MLHQHQHPLSSLFLLSILTLILYHSPKPSNISLPKEIMSSILWKNFFLCFSNFKCTTTLAPNSPSKHDTSSSLPSTTSTVIKTFNSLYEYSTTSNSLSSSTDNFFSSSDDSDTNNSPPDFATVFASQRFFFSSPGNSNSILHSPVSPPESTIPITGGGIPIRTYSPDPYLDFRRSMQEMVEARELTDVADDWDSLHELLLCYLALNPTHAHKFILSAFSDLLISLLSSKSRRKVDHCTPPS